jgi:hypothetical protein
MGVPDPIGPDKMVKGLWQVSFALTPVAGPSRVLSNPAVTRNGLTIQPLQLTLAPPGGLDGWPGGARAVIRISDLPKETRADTFTLFNTLSAGGGMSGITGSCAGGLVLLHGGDGTWLRPYYILLLAPAFSGPDQLIGADGAAEFEAIFPLTLAQARRTSWTLVLDHLRIATVASRAATPLNGPWVFHLTLP